MNDGDVERPQRLDQPLAGLAPTRHGREGRYTLVQSPRAGIGSRCTIPRGWRQLRMPQGAVEHPPCPPEVGRAPRGGGTAGRWGCPRQPGEGADGRGWLLSRCHQSAPAPPGAAASPGCKSDLNEAEGFLCKMWPRCRRSLR